MLTKKMIFFYGLMFSANTVFINFIQKYFGWSFGTDCEFNNPPIFDCGKRKRENGDKSH